MTGALIRKHGGALAAAFIAFLLFFMPSFLEAARAQADATQLGGDKTKEPFEQFTDSLLKQDGGFLFRGRWLSREALQDLWKEGKTFSAEGLEDDGSAITLNINVAAGKPDLWIRPEDRRLTYALDKRSMNPDQYQTVLNALRTAASDWEAACPYCGISFVHLPEFDQKPSTGDVTFVVKLDEQPLILATSFFPSAPPSERHIVVGPDFFSTELDRAGVMRHQLGHALGYRHEHIAHRKEIPGCPNEGNHSDYIAGAYDPASVMHYVCGGGGSIKMELSANDIRSHRMIYGETTISLEFGDADFVDSLAEAVRVFDKEGLLQTVPLDLSSAEACKDYLKEVGLAAYFAEKKASPRDCFGLSDLAKASESGKLDLPFVRLGQDKAFINGFISNDESRKFVNELTQRVELTRPAVFGKDDSGLRYDLQWRTYVLKVNVSDHAADAVLKRFEEIADRSPTIRLTVEDSVAREAAAQQGIRTYAATPVNPADRNNQDAICRPQPTSVGHYGRLLSSGLNFAQRTIEGVPIHDISCAYPQELQGFCAASCAGDQACSQEECAECRTCSARGSPHLWLIGDTIDPEALKALDPAAMATQCHWEAYEDRDHGTHLATIMGGRQRLIGLYQDRPIGFVPQPREDTKAFERSLKKEVERVESSVAVLATQLCYPKKTADYQIERKDGRDNRCDFQGNELAQTDSNGRRDDAFRSLKETSKANDIIINSSASWLWVAAIGQSEDAGLIKGFAPSPRFGPYSAASPHLLSDLPNVLLVTACDECSNDREPLKPRVVWDQAYEGIGPRQPRLAAPGGISLRERDPQNIYWVGGLPGMGTQGRYTRAYGTSQAAAIVGGVAAKMEACYPKHYRNPASLKAALQIASTPTLDPRVATGVLDVEMALRHPAYVHVLRQGGSWQSVHRERGDFRWCRDELVFDRLNDPAPLAIPAEDVRAIVKVRTGPDQWLLYRLKSGQTGEVERSELIAGMSDPAPIFQMEGQFLHLRDVNHLVMFRGLPESVADCPGQ